jgi:DNA polymerase-1
LGAHLADENDCAHHWGRLEDLCEAHFDKTAGDAQRAMVDDYGSKFKSRMASFTGEQVHDYATADVVNTYGLYGNVFERLQRQDPRLVSMWMEYSDYHHCITTMERTGMPVSVKSVSQRIPKAEDKKEEVLKDIRESCGWDYNPNSHTQTRRLLGLPDGHTTDKAYLDTLDSPMAKKIVAYREWTKILGSFYRPMLKVVDNNGVYHPDIWIHGTVSGRPSGHGGLNVLAIPRESDHYDIRSLFEAPEGWVFGSFDWSQVEIRILAHFCKDPFLLKNYEEDGDLHQRVADTLGISRDLGKRMNLGMVYGLGGNGLYEKVKSQGLSLDFCKNIVAAYHREFPGIKKLYNRCRQIAMEKGYITMWDGRRRRFDHETQQSWEVRKGMSGLIQGSVAGMMRRGQIRLHKEVVGPDVKLVNQVYDDALFLLREDRAIEAAREIRKVMEDYDFRVPIKVECKIGRSWGKCKVVELPE